MTAIADATTIFETIIGRTLSGPQLQRLGTAFFTQDPYQKGVYVDPENPTNEEKAQLVIDSMYTFTRRLVREEAGRTKRMELEVTIDAAIAAAEAAAEADVT